MNCPHAFLVIALLQTGSVQEPSKYELGPRGVSGKIVDTNLLPMPGVSVELTNLMTGAKLMTTTNDTGAYQLKCVTDGYYRLSFKMEGFLPVATRLRYLYPKRLRVNQLLNLDAVVDHRPPSLIIEVYDLQTGEPIKGALVEMGDEEGVTDECGKTWTVLYETEVPIRVSKRGYRTAEVPSPWAAGNKRELLRIGLNPQR